MKKKKAKTVVIRSMKEFRKHFYPKSDPDEIFKKTSDPKIIGNELARRSLTRAKQHLAT